MPEDGITFDARLLDADALKSVINYCMNGTLIKQGYLMFVSAMFHNLGSDPLGNNFMSALDQLSPSSFLSTLSFCNYPSDTAESFKVLEKHLRIKACEISSKVDNSERSMQIDSASNDVSQPALKARLHDFAISLLPGLDVKDFDLLLEVLEPALQDVGVVRKKAYKRYQDD
ncbi:hypothetical protein KIW84_013939 [Lathyrus oleraceus]|uniref:Uncharacterized protein n=1 Tax=Pisum sativum TaxID=3888 RepID=A0A9D5BLU5_PEA|nr:hypothetical protein KIW84_013937 [Pisum sativum]KAI5445898.1 hypothetical protein KIW84_013939 [Pisum sativum]